MTCVAKQFLRSRRPVFRRASVHRVHRVSARPASSCVITETAVRTHPAVWSHCHAALIASLSCNQFILKFIEDEHTHCRCWLLTFLFNSNKKPSHPPIHPPSLDTYLDGACWIKGFQKVLINYWQRRCLRLSWSLECQYTVLKTPKLLRLLKTTGKRTKLRVSL